MRTKSMDTLSQFSIDSSTSADSKDPVYIAAGDIRKRLSESIAVPKTSFEVRVPCEIYEWSKIRIICLSIYFVCKYTNC